MFVIFMGKPPFEVADAEKDQFYRMLQEASTDNQKELIGNDCQEFWTIWEDEWVAKNNIALSDSFKELFHSMTAASPDDRPRFQQLFNHPWLKQVDTWPLDKKASVIEEMRQIDALL